MHSSVISAESASPQQIEIMRAGPEERVDWDRFVDGAPSATFFHRYAWADVIGESFGHEPHYLLARREGRITGILPLIHKKSVLFGRALISTPFLSYGGVVSEDPVARKALELHAANCAEALSVQYLELRHIGLTHECESPSTTQYATFRKAIPENFEQIVRSVPRKGRRHDLKRSLRQDLVFEAPGHFEDFYSVLAESFRNLGTPIFPKAYFKRILEAFPQKTELCIVKKQGQAISAALVFYFRDQVQPFYAGGRFSARALHANDFLFLNIMKRARARGIGTFDFGRSKVGSGNYAYKSHWGIEAEPLSYQYKLIRGTRLPDLNPFNPRYRSLINLWRRLPLVAANVLGPRISRHLG